MWKWIRQDCNSFDFTRIFIYVSNTGMESKYIGISQYYLVTNEIDFGAFIDLKHDWFCPWYNIKVQNVMLCPHLEVEGPGDDGPRFVNLAMVYAMKMYELCLLVNLGFWESSLLPSDPSTSPSFFPYWGQYLLYLCPSAPHLQHWAYGHLSFKCWDWILQFVQLIFKKYY